jgi:protein-S-isoprenylcysteine O-methyltransferase Ste14
MIGEVSLYGIYFPPLLLLALLAYGVSRVLGALLARTGFYRHVWHPALFDFSLFVIVLGSIVFIGSNWF